MTAEMNIVLMSAIEHLGPEHQKNKCLEEIGEFLVEFSKERNGAENRSKIAEEIADVKVVLAQLELIYGISRQVNLAMDYKLVRLSNDIERDKAEQHVSRR